MKKFIYIVVIGVAIGASAIYVTLKEDGDSERTQQVHHIDLDLEARAETFQSNPNLDNSVETFLNSWVTNNEQPLATALTLTDSIGGYYAYGANIVERVDNKFSINLGATTIEVPKSKINFYEGFEDISVDSDEVIHGVAIVEYTDDAVASVEFRSVEAPIEDLRNAVLISDLVDEEKVSNISKQQDDFADLTVSDWQGMALLTTRESVNKQLAPPVFIVPVGDLTVAGSFRSSPYYIVAGSITKIENRQIGIATYEGKQIFIDVSLDQDVKLNTPSWIHLIVDSGKVVSVEVQTFEGADLTIMSMGLLNHISSHAVGR